jgi:flagellar basal-body rod modification protein FlgD
MNVSGVGSATTTSTNTTGSPQAVDYESFLKLLVAQMKNQDPTAPMDSTDYVAQLATFSQVEQSVQMNKKLEAMIQGNALAQATSLIGKQISTMDGKAGGIVKEVELYSDGTVLVLDNGTKVPMGSSFVVRDADFTPPTDDTPPDETADDETGAEDEQAA